MCVCVCACVSVCLCVAAVAVIPRVRAQALADELKRLRGRRSDPLARASGVVSRGELLSALARVGVAVPPALEEGVLAACGAGPDGSARSARARGVWCS